MRPGQPRPAELDRFESKLAERAAARGHPRGQRIPAPIQGDLPHRTDKADTELESAHAEIAELESGRERDRAEVADLRTELAEEKELRKADKAEFKAALDSIRAEFKAELESMRSSRDIPTRHSSDSGPLGRLDDPITSDAERDAPLAEAKKPRKVLSSEFINLYAASAGGALYTLGDKIPPTAQAAGYAAAALTIGVAGIDVIRKRIKERNANRSEG